MHEISLVTELVEVCRKRAADLPPGDRTVSVRYASTMPLDGLEHAFAMLIEGTELAGARLDAHLVERRLDCPACDFDGALEHDDVMADAAVCPGCGQLCAIPPGAELELLSVT